MYSNNEMINGRILFCFVFLDGPDSISVSPSGTTYTRNEGEPLSITCISDCYPGCSYSWRSPTGVVRSSDILYFGSLHRSDAGNYTCIATNIYVGITKIATGTITIIVRCK